MSGNGEYISREAPKEYIEREEAEKRLFQRAEIANSAYIDQTPCHIMMLAQNVVHLIPAADVVPLDYHERCLQIEVEKRLALELQMPRWIPAAERLPVSGVPVLICGDGNVVEQGFFDDEFGYWYDSRGYRTFVHHWMPLPQPPKEG